MDDDRRRKAKPTKDEQRQLLLDTKRKALAGDTAATLALGTLLLTDAIERSIDTRTPDEVDLSGLY